ncbi:trypsin-like peptidase domain-containing protein [Fictibacillus sp. Mic-4]|uniref:S1C family serine protease n=1 Tax=Fictibacillus TaxID=1329200 RepID=UPI00041254E3|nr:trypsin-like peptidase domain-containing protein [Fictibacillus gelatini]
MGYYDGYEPGPDDQRGRGRRKSVFFPALAGAIVGALIMLICLPILSNAGLLPDYFNNQETDQAAVDKGPTKSVNVNVTSNVTDAVAKAQDAVVEVTNIQKGNFWDQENKQVGIGSGVIYKKAGGKAYIVTNNHVVEDANQLEVTLSNKKKVPAKLLGADVWTDLAVIEINGKYVDKVAQFGSSKNLKPGEPAIAIGNPLGRFTGSVTEGVVSSVDRTIPVDINDDNQPDWQAEVIQTDASINPGNSGGALLNIAGQVIGINSSKWTGEAVEGIGFAIPSDLARPIIADLEQFGEVKRPFLGVTSVDLSQISDYHRHQTLKLSDKVTDGVVVTSVEGPAKEAGLKELDVITELNGEKIKSQIELRQFLYNKAHIGDKIKVTYYRAGHKETTTVKLGKQQPQLS